MRVWRTLLPVGAWSVLFVIVILILGALPAAAQQAALKVEEIPDSPGAVLAKLGEPAQSQNSPAQHPGVSSPTPPSQSSFQSRDAQAPQKPVGTAAAEAPNANGVAASQPAGVAMAPAKQRRVRTIILRTGAIIGAGVAVGSVVALTAGTSSRPPGAH
jgi:cytoskeletal protein RodZ